jgi:flagellar biosynthetic protein FliR
MDPSALASFGVLLVRPGLLIVAAPAWGGTYAPAFVKAGLTVTIAIVLAGVVRVPAAAGETAIALVIAREALIGLSLAIGIRALLAAAELAGYLAGFQIGFTYATVADPQSGVGSNILSSIYGLLALVVFFAADGHHAFLRALALSYDALPIGLGAVDAAVGVQVARLLGVVFGLGLQLALPVVAVLLTVEVALGLVSRAAPSFNVMAEGFPIRIAVGLLTLAATLPLVPALVTKGVPSVLEIGTRLAEAFK